MLGVRYLMKDCDFWYLDLKQDVSFEKSGKNVFGFLVWELVFGMFY